MPKKYLLFRKSNNKLEMVSDGPNQYDQNNFYIELMNLTNVKLDEIYNGKETFLINDRLKIKPADKTKQETKQELLKELEAADSDVNKLKEVIKKIIK